MELTLRTTRRGLAQVRQAARQVGAAATVRREQGAPLLARRLRRRYVLLAGLLLTVLLVLEGNFTIWEFQVSGNETVPDEVILRALRTTASPSAPGVWTSTRRTCATMCCWS